MLLFTGPCGRKFGYQDGWDAEGFYHYTGEGQVGDMMLARGNAAIANHVQRGKELHLFQEITHGHLRYIGQMIYLEHHWEHRLDREGKERNAVVFKLVPVRPFEAERKSSQQELELGS